MILKNKILISSLLIIASLSALLLNSTYTAAVPPKINLVPSDYATNITWQNAQKIDKPVVINFYVDWCHFCKGFAPILDRLRQEYSSKYSFVYINCENPENEPLIRKFNIQGYPSLFLFDKKKNRKLKVDNSKYQNINLLRSELNKFSK